MKRTISAMVGKGSLNHNSREFYASNVDPSRSHLNIEFCREDIRNVYHELFDEAQERFNAKQTRNDRRIEDYYEKICSSKKEKPFHEIVLQIGNKDDTGIHTELAETAKQCLIQYANGFQARNPTLRVFWSHLHMDEATPHVHIDFVPYITGSKRGMDTRVSLKQALSQLGFKGGTRSATEWNQWAQSEKQVLAEIICIVFAQLERETIQKRVTDAYYSRCQHGFHMSGAAPYGFQLEPTTIEGIRTKMMKPDPETADIAKLMFEMYSQPATSFGDIARYFADEGILIYGKEMTRGFISQLLRNPIYAQADLDMYEFFKSQGTVVVNEATDFAGTNGCYLYQGRDVQERKNKHLKDQILVLAPSEGLVSSDTWLRCRKKLMANKTFQGGRKAKNTWLAGKVKCGRCGYALMSVGNPTGVQYLRCSKRADSKSCDGCGTLRTREFERFLYGEMVKKLSEFQTLTAKRETVNPKLTALNMELARVEDEIEKLLNTLTGANAVLLSYANSKIEELDTRRQTLTKEIAALSAEAMSPEQIERLSVYLNQWEEIDFEDRRQVADGLISQIRATDEHVSIEWKI